MIDASGKYVFPGFIDPHTHIYLPFMGTFAKDDYESGTKAALVGGTTTIFDMCCPARSTEPRDGFATWLAQAEGKAACDYSFHMGVTRFDENTAAQLCEIVAAGVQSFKIFLAYKGAFGIDDSELFKTLSLAKELGVVTAAHCENETLVSELQAQLLARGITGPEGHYMSRPPRVEAEGVHHLMTFAELTGAPVYIVHLSCREALDEALKARARGVNVRIETLIQYLTLDKKYAELPNFEGAKYVMSPPLRERINEDVLWNALERAPSIPWRRTMRRLTSRPRNRWGAKILRRSPTASRRSRIALRFSTPTASREAGSLHDLVNVASTNAAKIFNLFPRKGTIQPGSDADLVIFDPDYRGTISAKTQTMNVDYNVFEDWKVEGRPETVTVRGEVAVRDGKFVGTVGRGRFLKAGRLSFEYR